MCSAISPNLEKSDNYFHLPYQVVNLSNGISFTLTDQNLQAKESVEIFFSYQKEEGEVKNASIIFGKDTSFFSHIQLAKNQEEIKALVVQNVSSFLEVHEIGQIGVSQLQAQNSKSSLSAQDIEKLRNSPDKAFIKHLDLSDLDVTGLDVSGFTEIDSLDLEDAQGDIKAMFSTISFRARESIEDLDLSGVDVTGLSLFGFVNLKKLALKNIKGDAKAMFNAIPAEVKASIKDLDLDGVNVERFNFSGFDKLKINHLRQFQELSVPCSLPEEVLSSRIIINASIITQLIAYSISKGEAWKEYFAYINALTSRLRPIEVINNCMQAMEEICFHKQTIFKEGGDYSVLLEKKMLAANTEVITTGDLHGDAYSLAKMLEKLQDDDKLNECFELAENIELVFLGDYVDRGPDSWAVLNMLIVLKLNNMDRVHLIRGNHEDTGMIFREGGSFGDWMSTDNDVSNRFLTKDHRCFQDRANNTESRALDLFFDTLPNAVFLGVNKPDGVVEYEIYTHGAVPLSFNPNKLLARDDGMYSIPRKANELGEHSFTDISPYMELLTQEEEAEFIRSAGVVNQAVGKHRPLLVNGRSSSTEDTEWNWADITVVNPSDHHFDRGAYINLDDFISWMDCSEIAGKAQLPSRNIFFKRFFKGHSHKEAEVLRGDREFYFLDTDLYAKGNFVMHSHEMGRYGAKVGIRPYREEFMEGDSLSQNETF
jgi:hypothetical protein